MAFDLKGGRMFITDYAGSLLQRQYRRIKPENIGVCGKKPQ